MQYFQRINRQLEAIEKSSVDPELKKECDALHHEMNPSGDHGGRGARRDVPSSAQSCRGRRTGQRDSGESREEKRRSAPDAGHPVRQPVGVVLLRHDRLPRPARLRRPGRLRHHSVAGRGRPARTATRHHAGVDRPVLALCRYRVDLLVPLAVFGLKPLSRSRCREPSGSVGPARLAGSTDRNARIWEKCHD